MTGARADAGRALRRSVPRSSHATWEPGRERAPLVVLEATNRRRVPELVAIRKARMRASPFAFLRGAPAVMAADLATTPVTGITVQACGDAHLLNFGLFATPERNLVFGLNDFDETLPGPWEWDVKRLATSFVVATRTVGGGPAPARRAALATVRTYREQLARFAGMRALEVWYSRVDGSTIATLTTGRRRRAVSGRLAAAQHHTNLDALPRLTEPDRGGGRRFAEDPPLLTHVEECGEAWVAEVLARYRASLPEERRRLLARFRPHDAARKVVGVGSVGTRCYVVLLLGDHPDDPLLLQVKQATASVLEPYAGRSRHRHHGRRVVSGQRLLQTASDIFLGWTGDGAAHYYVRQLWDMKGSMQLERMTPGDLVEYGRLCGWVLARAHARSGDAAAISGYLGTGSRFDGAVADFAEAYADQTEADYAAFVDAGEGLAAPGPGRSAGTNQRKGAAG